MSASIPAPSERLSAQLLPSDPQEPRSPRQGRPEHARPDVTTVTPLLEVAALLGNEDPPEELPDSPETLVIEVRAMTLCGDGCGASENESGRGPQYTVPHTRGGARGVKRIWR
jgi:hypothetical protein